MLRMPKWINSKGKTNWAILEFSAYSYTWPISVTAIFGHFGNTRVYDTPYTVHRLYNDPNPNPRCYNCNRTLPKIIFYIPQKFYVFSSTIYKYVPYVNIYDIQHVFDLVDNPWDGYWLLPHWIYPNCTSVEITRPRLLLKYYTCTTPVIYWYFIYLPCLHLLIQFQFLWLFSDNWPIIWPFSDGEWDRHDGAHNISVKQCCCECFLDTCRREQHNGW